ncbi:MAG: B12-binding domain-containing radical SAM protein [Acidobacteriota bacterium]|nr:B12-binding domain-containing radical SAM protein [Acidobacteriota bacterium]MDH3525547.1 B12-binding domain-containing radical SAM protein [Acidobacteriota bacterium]
MKLGLLATSGIRVQNEDLLRAGLTLPGLVRRGELIASLPSLGLLTLAGLTPPEIDLEYVDVPEPREFRVDSAGYDAVALSSFTARIKETYELADRFRQVGTKVILGGLHVSALPDEAAAHADAVVTGEGEVTWPRLVGDLLRGDLQARYDSGTASYDLADAPMPRFDLLDPEAYSRLTVQTQRGCPFRCSFCAASITIAPTFKTKPVAKVIAEIRRIKEIWPKPFLEFADDNTFVDKRHARKLMKALAEEDVRWFTESDVSIAGDPELLRLMRDSGCRQVLIGFESTSLSGLDGVELRSNWKAKQLGGYRRAIATIQEQGITVNGCFVLGLDGTGKESFDDVLDFVESTGLYEVQLTVQTAFPGTPLEDRLRRSGRLLAEDAWELCTLFDVNYVPERMSASELETSFRELIEEIYEEDAVRRRRETYIERLRELVAPERDE